MKFIVDIDGTLTHFTGENAKDHTWYLTRPLKHEVRDKVNQLYEKGHFIVLHTSRHEEYRRLTIEWLSEYHVQILRHIFSIHLF